MPYVADHEKSCKDKNRYVITRKMVVIEDRRGVILSNSDRGEVLSVRCESCNAPAEWKAR